MSAEENAAAFEQMAFYLDYFNKNDPFNVSFVDCKIKPISATINPKDPTLCTTVFELEVPPKLLNSFSTLHGGAVAALFDILTSICILAIAREGLWEFGHVTRTLNCTYVRPAKVGEILVVESEMVHLGKNMCIIKGVMKRKSDGAICFTCEHGKVRLPSPKL